MKTNRSKQEDGAAGWGEGAKGIMEDGVNSLCPGWSLWRGGPESEHRSCFEELWAGETTPNPPQVSHFHHNKPFDSDLLNNHFRSVHNNNNRDRMRRKCKD